MADRYSTKTQRKRALVAILTKAQKLMYHSGGKDFQLRMTVDDFKKIEAICMKYMKKL